MRLSTRIAAIAIAAASAIAISTSPASAADLVTVKIGSSTELGASNIYKIGSTTSVFRTVATFSNHKASSVRLVKFTVCFSRTGGGQTTISPYTRNTTGNYWDSGVYRVITAGTCQTWNVNKVYSKQVDGEVVRVVNRVDAGRAETVGFYR